MPEPSIPLLRLSKITKRFGVIRAVWNVDLEVSQGDSLAIFGPNGAGKTTLLRVIASLTQPTSGEIEFAFKGDNQSRNRVGYVSHLSLLYNELTGFENLLFYARLYDIQKAHDRAAEMLAKMGLEGGAQSAHWRIFPGYEAEVDLGSGALTRTPITPPG